MLVFYLLLPKIQFLKQSFPILPGVYKVVQIHLQIVSM